MEYQEGNWSQPRSVVLLQHNTPDKKRAGGKKLIDNPGYLSQALVTNMPLSVRAIAVWREYSGRVSCEEVVEELDAHVGLPHLCLKGFWATETALSLGIVAYHLCTLFQRKLGRQSRVTATTLRFRPLTTRGIISNKAGRTTIRLDVSEEQHQWWREVLAKHLCKFPTCNPASQCP